MFLSNTMILTPSSQKVEADKKDTTRQRLKYEFFLYRSIDRYGSDQDGQATFYSGHKITVLICPVCFSKGIPALGPFFSKCKLEF